MRPESKPRQSLLAALALLPACFLGAFICKYWVDLPHWDQWEYVSFFKKLSVGTLTPGDLFAQQNEYRQFFPNLIFVGLGWLTKWDVRYELVVSFLLACLVSFNVHRLGDVTIGGPRARRLFIWFLANLLIFSPVQRENWLLGMQLVYFLPVACVTTGLVIAYSKLSAPSKLLSCMCLATISTFSSANGIVCWLVLFPLLYLLAGPNGEGGRSNRKLLILFWSSGFLANAALYLNGYHKPPHHPNLAASLSHPWEALTHFCSLLGHPLALRSLVPFRGSPSTHALIVSATTGFAMAVLFAFLTFSIRRDTRLTYRVAGWLSLGAYSLSTALLVTFGRAGFGLRQSSEFRYTTFTLYLPVALLYLLPIVLEGRGAEGSAALRQKLMLPVLAGVFVFSQLFAYPSSLAAMNVLSARLWYGKACLLFINVVQEKSLSKRVYPDVDKLQREANVLNGLGYLRPSLISSDRAQDLAAASAHCPKRYGSFTLVRASENEYTAAGWAVLPERGASAHAILLTYDSADAKSVVFAVAATKLTSTNGPRRRRPAREDSRWQKSLAASDLPADPKTIAAWAFDAGSGKAFQLTRTDL